MKNLKRILLGLLTVGLLLTSCNKQELDDELIGNWIYFNKTYTNINEVVNYQDENIQIAIGYHGKFVVIENQNIHPNTIQYSVVGDKIYFNGKYINDISFPENGQYLFKWGKKDTLVIKDLDQPIIHKLVKR